ncbi:MAG: SDR family NAD(P)-dependent oxidoreductase [Deltaproteobacteria bacterium]|nr:SDR family NAD(P)-dependent oxidoreductase [Deltaproteobacteria bacterium]
MPNQDNGRFAEKIVFITGASSGIGEALAKELARQGAKIVLAARRVDRMDGVVNALRDLGRVALAIPCDVTKDGDLERAVAKAEEAFGRIDIVIANAGFGVVGKVEKLSLEDYRRQFETNVFGVLRTIHATLGALKQSKGTLVLMGSVAGYVSVPGSSPYSMSKHAVQALAHSLFHELKPHGVAVVHFCPGFIDTEIREVDNRGVRHPGRKDRNLDRLQMDCPKAARIMAKAIGRRCPEVVITNHGKGLVFMQRHFPWLVRMAISLFSVKGRKQPTDSH